MIRFLFSPQGRISGTQFFTYIALSMLAMLVIGFGLGTLPAINGPLILSGVWIVQAWPLVCALCKRLHDTGHSAVWLWLLAPQACIALASLASGFLAPPFLLVLNLLGIAANLLCWALIFCLAVKNGDDGDNAYGPDPHRGRDPITASAE